MLVVSGLEFKVKAGGRACGLWCWALILLTSFGLRFDEVLLMRLMAEAQDRQLQLDVITFNSAISACERAIAQASREPLG